MRNQAGSLTQKGVVAMAVIKYTKPPKVNPYAGEIADLIAAGDGSASELVVNTERVKGEKGGGVDAQKSLFQEAARAAGKSARFVVQEPAKGSDGKEIPNKTRLIATLGPLRKSTKPADKPAEKPSK